MAFIVFSHKKGPRGLEKFNAPMVRILPGTKRINFSRKALEMIKASDHIVFYFDPLLGHIGIRAGKHSDPLDQLIKVNGTKLEDDGRTTGTPGATLAGFADEFGIDLKRAGGTHRMSFDERSGLAIVVLPPGSWTKPVARRP